MSRLSLLPVLALCCGLPAGCGGEPATETSPATDDTPVADTPAAPEAEAPLVADEAAPGPYPFEGKWAGPSTDCALEPGSAEAAPLHITDSFTQGYENRCEILDVAPLDDGSGERFEMSRRCTGEGVTYDETLRLRVSGDTLMLQTESASITWTRCPEETVSE